MKVKELKISTYSNFWLDNGIVSLYSLIKNCKGISNLELTNEELCFTINDLTIFIDQLRNNILREVNRVLFFQIQDPQTKLIKIVRRQYVISQQVKGGALKEKIFNEEHVKQQLEDAFDFDTKKKTCVICGNEYSKSKNLTQTVFPLVTKMKSLGGIRGNKEYIDVCPICYLVSASAWLDNNIYTNIDPSTKGFSILLLPIQNNLVNYYKVKKMIRTVTDMQTTKMSSILVKSITQDRKKRKVRGYEKYSTLLLLLEELMHKLREPDSDPFSAKLNDLVNTEWYSLTIPHGGMKNIKTEIISIDHRIINLLNTLIEKYNNLRIYSDFVDKIYVTSDGKPDFASGKKIKESLAMALIKNDLDLFCTTIFPSRGLTVSFSFSNIDFLLYEWRLRILNYGMEKLEVFKKTANIIAEVSKKNTGLFYRLDKTRTFSDFLESIKDAARGMVSLSSSAEQGETKYKISPTAFDDFLTLLLENQQHWKDIKSILIIYTAMYYSIKMKKIRG